VQNPLTAITRFGLGPNASDLAAARPDPGGWVLAQLASPAPVPEAMAALPSLETLARDQLGAGAALRMAQREVRRAMLDVRSEGMDGMTDAEAPGSPLALARQARNQALTEVLRAEVQARIDAFLEADRPLVERLVLFFSNHFAIGPDKPNTRGLAGHYERTLRPHVLGRFRDLLGAAVLHPAMLSYLDNTASIGPNSRAGRTRDASYNENLARELLELHTLGVDGGYTQDDIIQLALVLTGWTGGFELDPREAPEAQRLAEPFLRARHEPGPKTILGRTYPEAGAEEIEAVLDDLAVHPATARHLSGKLARHFVGDGVSQATVEAMARTFLDTDGDLAAVMTTLVSTDEAWTAAPKKVVPPYDFVLSAFRAFEMPGRLGIVRQSIEALGHPMWRAPAPAGWPDHDTAWISGDMLLERIDWATDFAGRVAPRRDDIAGDALAFLGEAAEGELLTAIRRADGRVQAMTLLLMSPHWQVR
jgi:uncharacterized protein (DUF1800 family)